MINIEIEVLSENDEKVTCLVKRPCGHICEVDLQVMKVIRELDVRVAEPGDETKKTFRVVTFGKGNNGHYCICCDPVCVVYQNM